MQTLDLDNAPTNSQKKRKKQRVYESLHEQFIYKKRICRYKTTSCCVLQSDCAQEKR